MIAALVSYYILILPHCGWAVWSSLEVWQLRLSGQEYNYSSTFSITPWWDTMVQWITRHIKGLSALFPIAGVILWLTGGSSGATHNPERSSNPLQ
jgi:hypothetical protein